MLFLTLLAIAALAVLPDAAFQIRRDREEEMLHRGVAYSRAIRRYYKRLGTYPNTIDQLQNTNNVRFLRKRYTDPLNVVDGKEQEFKILHVSDMPPGSMAGLAAAGIQNAGQNLAGAAGNANQAAQLAAQQVAVAQAAAVAQQAQQNAPGDAANAAGDDSENPQTPQNGPGPSASPATGPSPLSPSAANGPQTFGGGAMIGVASRSKKKSLREFCKKNHYNDWKFIFDTSTDRGAITTPWCPLTATQGVGAGFNQNGINPVGGGQTGFGGQPAPSGAGPSRNLPQNPADNMPPDQ